MAGTEQSPRKKINQQSIQQVDLQLREIKQKEKTRELLERTAAPEYRQRVEDSISHKKTLFY